MNGVDALGVDEMNRGREYHRPWLNFAYGTKKDAPFSFSYNQFPIPNYDDGLTSFLNIPVSPLEAMDFSESLGRGQLYVKLYCQVASHEEGSKDHLPAIVLEEGWTFLEVVGVKVIKVSH